MKLLVKSLTGGSFHVDVEASDTVATVKQNIQASQGHLAEYQKLIYSGKILSDEKTMGEYEIKEKDFLVVMVSKPKAKKSETSGTSTATATTPSKLSEDAPKPPEPVATSTTSQAQDTAAAPTSSEPPSTPAPSSGGLQTGSFLSGTELETAVNSIMEMGFPKNDVQRAMRMSFNNPDRAVEYLMNGLPEETAPAPAATTGVPATPGTPSPTPASATAQASAPRSGNLFEQAAAMQAGSQNAPQEELIGEEDEQGRQVLDLGNPQVLSQLRTLLEQNPAALQPLVQALVQSNPQLAEAMSADPEGVLRMLSGEGLEGEESFEVPTLQQLTDEDRAQVEQIIAMGIPERKAIESYFMCGRNLEMAVQYYFENPQDFED